MPRRAVAGTGAGAEATEEASAVLERAREQATETRRSAEEHARQTIGDAESKARRIVDEGERRRGDVETVISDLVSRRDALLADIDRLTVELKAAVSAHAPRPGSDPVATPTELDPVDRRGRAEGEPPQGEQVET